MKYTVSIENPEKHFIHFKGETETSGETSFIFQLPLWRPGRYERQNYVSNLFNLFFFDENGSELSYQKMSTNQWAVKASNAKKVLFKYDYYAFVYDGGSTFLDEKELYINPVNCFFYVLGKENEPIEVKFNLPENYVVATGLKETESFQYIADSFDELADCPLMAGTEMERLVYKEGDVNFNVWLCGENRLHKADLLTAFKKFTKEQFGIFGSFPVDEYHFLIKIMPQKAYHGVEHTNSTVVVIGPSYALQDQSFFLEHFLGVSSHELFHTWNVKALRPAEYFPYDFTKDNYSPLGYVAEGATTYYGDLMLLRSGLMSLEVYLNLFAKSINIYKGNFGRENLSLAESSIDTWVDGYKRNFPSRRVSIYNEGSLVTFMLDIDLLKKTGGKASFDTVMKSLYEKFALKGKGFSEKDFKQVLEETGQCDYTKFFEKYIWGKTDYEDLLKESFLWMGIELAKENAIQLAKSHFGMVMQPSPSNKIMELHPNSPLMAAGISNGDTIVSVNGKSVDNNLEEWLRFYNNEQMVLVFNRAGETREITVENHHRQLYPNYVLKPADHTTENQKKLLYCWIKRK